MKRLLSVLVALGLFVSPPARADLFGGDVAVLVQILSNALEQLAQMKQIFDNGKDTLGLLRDVNRGINDSLNLIRTIKPDVNPGIYKDWDKAQDALNKLEQVYGIVVDSRDSTVQRDSDQSVAEAVALNNSIYKYTQAIDEIGEMIKQESHSVSPGGAAKLTAQSLGVMLNVQNEMLRTQATGLKLQAQALAVQNRKDKDRTRQMVEGTNNLTSALTNLEPTFKTPRFE
jgi:hypothetical protein